MPVHIPTDEELQAWYPDPAQKRTRWIVNVQTNERKEVELTLEEYRARHKAKMVEAKRREDAALAEQQKEADRISAIGKLKGLGLTDREIAAL